MSKKEIFKMEWLHGLSLISIALYFVFFNYCLKYYSEYFNCDVFLYGLLYSLLFVGIIWYRIYVFFKRCWGFLLLISYLIPVIFVSIIVAIFNGKLNEDIIRLLFTAQVALSSISIGLIALIIGHFQEKMYGVKISEYFLFHSKKPINMSNIIKTIFICIIINFIFITFLRNNTLNWVNVFFFMLILYTSLMFLYLLIQNTLNVFSNTNMLSVEISVYYLNYFKSNMDKLKLATKCKEDNLFYNNEYSESVLFSMNLQHDTLEKINNKNLKQTQNNVIMYQDMIDSIDFSVLNEYIRDIISNIIGAYIDITAKMIMIGNYVIATNNINYLNKFIYELEINDKIDSNQLDFIYQNFNTLYLLNMFVDNLSNEKNFKFYSYEELFECIVSSDSYLIVSFQIGGYNSEIVKIEFLRLFKNLFNNIKDSNYSIEDKERVYSFYMVFVEVYETNITYEFIDRLEANERLNYYKHMNWIDFLKADKYIKSNNYNLNQDEKERIEQKFNDLRYYTYSLFKELLSELYYK